jgi:ankyrin repeat protein
LVEHLGDPRPTKTHVKHEGHFGGMFFSDEYDYNSRTTKQAPQAVNGEAGEAGGDLNEYTVTVGDLCFVALGEIVNRRFSAMYYQPTACFVINSPTHSVRLRQAITKEWSGLTAELHKASLIRDFLEPDSEDRRQGACLRLGYYYPDALEPVVLKQLAEPRYSAQQVQDFVRNKLYRTREAQDRKKLVEAFVAERGDVARQGMILFLFWDLEVDEEGRDRLEGSYAAGACLSDVFGYPKNVKSSDKPSLLPLTNGAQAGIIGTLVYFPSDNIDRAVRKVLHSTDDLYLASACQRYLIGRGADADIRQFVDKRLAKADDERRKEFAKMLEKLGWTRLHVAAEDGEPQRIKTLIRQEENVNARATNGQTPLHVAAKNGHIAAIRELLDAKADPNIKDKNGRSAIELALDCDPAVDALLGGGAQPTDILTAAFAGRADLVEGFLAKDKTLVGAQTLGGATPLHLAARRGNLKVAEVLLDHGAEVDALEGKNLFTPLHVAAMHGQTKLAALLLARGANPRAKSWDGKIPITYAVDRNDAETIRLLQQALDAERQKAAK